MRRSSSSRTSSPRSSGESCHAAKCFRVSASSASMVCCTLHRLLKYPGRRSLCRAIRKASSGCGGWSTATQGPAASPSPGRKRTLPLLSCIMTSTSMDGSPSRTAARAPASLVAPTSFIQSSSASPHALGDEMAKALALRCFLACSSSYVPRAAVLCGSAGRQSGSQP